MATVRTSDIAKRTLAASERTLRRVSYRRETRTFTVLMATGTTYKLRLDDVSAADASDVARWSVSRGRDYIRVRQASGNSLEIPWDTVLHLCEPRYRYHKSRTGQSGSNTTATRIGERIRNARA